MGDRHLVTIPQGVVGDRLPWGGERQGGGVGIFGTTVFVVSDVTWGLKTFYRTLPPNDVCLDVILSHS